MLRNGKVLLHSTPDGRSLMLADSGSDSQIGRFQAGGFADDVDGCASLGAASAMLAGACGGFVRHMR